MNITAWMLEKKYATHWKEAENIIAGLHLGELHKIADYEGIKQRVRDYRQWRNATDDPPKVCYERVLRGEKPPSTLFEIAHDPNAYNAGYNDAFHDGLHLPQQLSCGCDECRQKYEDGQEDAMRKVWTS